MEPVDDERFDLMKRLYSYDRTGLNASVDAIDDSSPYGRKETVTFDAAYGEERVTAYLFLPKSTIPPCQVVMICPTGGSNLKGRSLNPLLEYWSFYLRTGRAVMFPVLKGTFARRLPSDTGDPAVRSDFFTFMAKDLGRAIDYLQTRDDVDHERIGYWGFSATAFWWPIFGATQKRLKAAVLWVGGLGTERPAPEVSLFNFAPRATAPVLLMNGRYDLVVGLESGQRLHDLLGTPEEHKKLVIFDGGHIPIQRDEIVKMTLDWFDRYLGPVNTKSSQ